MDQDEYCWGPLRERSPKTSWCINTDKIVENDKVLPDGSHKHAVYFPNSA